MAVKPTTSVTSTPKTAPKTTPKAEPKTPPPPPPPPPRPTSIEVARGVRLNTDGGKQTVKVTKRSDVPSVQTKAPPQPRKPVRTGGGEDHTEDTRSPTSMAGAMQATRDAKAEVQKALKADATQGTPASRAKLQQALDRYDGAVEQQVRIATWRAQIQGGDVDKAIEQQARFASSLEIPKSTTAGRSTRLDRAVDKDMRGKLSGAVADHVAERARADYRAQPNADIRAVRIEQIGTIRVTNPTALKAKAQDDARRVQDLQGYGSGYVRQAAQDDAAKSGVVWARALAGNDGFEAKVAALQAKDAKAALYRAQVRVGAQRGQVPASYQDPALGKAETTYAQKLADSKEASSVAELSAALAKSLQSEGDVVQAQRAYAASSDKFVDYDGSKVTDYNKMTYSNGYDPTARVLPPSDLGQKAVDGNSKNPGQDGTEGVRVGVYEMKDGSRVQRGADGKWTVLNLGVNEQGRMGKPQAMNPQTAQLWESRYQAAKADAEFTSALSYASQPSSAPLAGDLSLNLANDKQAVEVATRKLASDEADRPGARQTFAANLGQAKAKLELTRELAAWREADRTYQEAKVAGTATPAQREASQDAHARVRRARAGVQQAQAKIEMVAANQNLQQVLGDKTATPEQRAAAWDRYKKAGTAESNSVQAFTEARDVEKLTQALSTEQMRDPLAVRDVLAPPPSTKGHRADTGLEMLVGGLELVGAGVAVAAGVATSWTGVGAVGFGATAAVLGADGLARLGHGTVDMVKDQQTDPYWSRIAQKAGMSQTDANRLDTAIGLGAGLIGGGPGALKLALQGARAIKAGNAAAGAFKLSGAGLSVAMLGDMSYAQGSFVLTGEQKTPVATQWLMRAGMSETVANYAQVLGGLGVGVGGGVAKRVVRARAPKEVPLPRLFNERPWQRPPLEHSIAGRKAAERQAPVRVHETIGDGGLIDLQVRARQHELGVSLGLLREPINPNDAFQAIRRERAAGVVADARIAALRAIQEGRFPEHWTEEQISRAQAALRPRDSAIPASARDEGAARPRVLAAGAALVTAGAALARAPLAEWVAAVAPVAGHPATWATTGVLTALVAARSRVRSREVRGLRAALEGKTADAVKLEDRLIRSGNASAAHHIRTAIRAYAALRSYAQRSGDAQVASALEALAGGTPPTTLSPARLLLGGDPATAHRMPLPLRDAIKVAMEPSQRRDFVNALRSLALHEAQARGSLTRDQRNAIGKPWFVKNRSDAQATVEAGVASAIDALRTYRAADQGAKGNTLPPGARRVRDMRSDRRQALDGAVREVDTTQNHYQRLLQAHEAVSRWSNRNAIRATNARTTGYIGAGAAAGTLGLPMQFAAPVAYGYRGVRAAAQAGIAERIVKRAQRPQPPLDWLENKLVKQGGRHGISKPNQEILADAIRTLRANPRDKQALDTLKGVRPMLFSVSSPLGTWLDRVALASLGTNDGNNALKLYHEGLPLGRPQSWSLAPFAVGNYTLANAVQFGRQTGNWLNTLGKETFVKLQMPLTMGTYTGGGIANALAALHSGFTGNPLEVARALLWGGFAYGAARQGINSYRTGFKPGTQPLSYKVPPLVFLGTSLALLQAWALGEEIAEGVNDKAKGKLGPEPSPTRSPASTATPTGSSTPSTTSTAGGPGATPVSSPGSTAPRPIDPAGENPRPGTPPSVPGTPTRPHEVRVDRNDPRRASLWQIAKAHVDEILTPTEIRALRKRGGQVAVEREATLRLIKANGMDPRLMDGHITHDRARWMSDPDGLMQGWKVNVNVLGLARTRQ